MPGIAGVFEPGCTPDTLGVLLDRMKSVITHEPWYQVDTCVQPPIAAARVGLGIFNPQPQPGGNEDSSVLVWMDGEIYDYQRHDLVRRLRAGGHQLEQTSDPCLLAHLYEDLGEACVRDLDGTFSVAIFDQRQDKLVIAVDRFATRHLYFYASGGRFLFASEVKAILQDPRVLRCLDEQGLIEFFTFRHPLEDRTLFRDVRFLPAGYLVTFSGGQAQVQRYWTPSVIEDQPPRSLEQYLDEHAAGLRQAFERQLSDGKPVGLFLSGGLDSRQLAAQMALLGGDFHTFSRGPIESWDIKFGTLVAERVGSQHHVLDLPANFLATLGRRGVWLTDGLMAAIDIYELNATTTVKSFVDVVIFGMGSATHVLSGIALSKKIMQSRSLDEAAHEFFEHEGVYIPPAMQAQLLSDRLLRATHGATYEALHRMLNTYQADTPAGHVEAFCIQCRWPRSSGYGPFLARTQVETRSPYSDPDLLAAACRVPAHWRLKRQMQIALLKHTRPDLARLPWEFTGLPVDRSTPARIFIQRGLYFARRRASQLTRGLIPAGTQRERANHPMWFRTTLKQWLEGILLDKRTLERGYLNEASLRQIIYDHMTGRRNYSMEFGLLLTFELWNRLFIDGETP